MTELASTYLTWSLAKAWGNVKMEQNQDGENPKSPLNSYMLWTILCNATAIIAVIMLPTVSSPPTIFHWTSTMC